MRLNLLHNLALSQHQAFSIFFFSCRWPDAFIAPPKKIVVFFAYKCMWWWWGWWWWWWWGIDVALPHTDIVSPKQPFNLHYKLCILCFTMLPLILLVIWQSTATFNCYFGNQIQTLLPTLTHVWDLFITANAKCQCSEELVFTYLYFYLYFICLTKETYLSCC